MQPLRRHGHRFPDSALALLRVLPVKGNGIAAVNGVKLRLNFEAVPKTLGTKSFRDDLPPGLGRACSSFRGFIKNGELRQKK